MVHINSKLPQVGTSVFTVMSSLAITHKAINLGQGFPDFPMNDALMELVNKAMKGGYNQYAHSSGVPALKEAISAKIEGLYGTITDPEAQITITPGGTYAIYTALTSVLRPRDEVIVFEPAYDSYIPNIEVNGAVPVLINLRFPDYKIDWDEVRSRINARTRMIILNSPHNPSGAVLGLDDITRLREVVKDTNIIILSDEVYEHLIFDGIPHQSILRYPDLLERSFVCFSFGKVYHCTGWKLGYCVSSAAFMQEFRKVHQFNCFSCNTPFQVALAGFITNQDSYLHVGAFMQEKRDYFQELMRQTRFTPLPSYGSYFQLYKYDRLSNEGAIDFAKRLTTDFGVATIPVSAFYRSGKDDKVIRFCFAKKNETLEMAVSKLIDA